MSFSHPLFRCFENEVTVGGQKLEWATHGRDFVMRPQGADEKVVWFFLGRKEMKEFFSLQRNAAHGKDGRTKLEHSVLGRQFWRFWHLPSGEECFLRKNYGIFRSRNGELVRFDFPVPFANFSEASAEEMEQFLASLSGPGSDLEGAKHWANIPLPQRVRQLFVLRGGNFDELEALIRGALVLSGEPETRFAMRDVMVMPGRTMLVYETHQWRTHPVEAYFDILNRYFYLERTTEEWRGHDELGDPEEVPYPVYTCSQPNQHECLEARLNWRDFLHDKLPPEEIDALLSKPYS